MIAEKLSRLRFFFQRPPAAELEEELHAHMGESIAAKMATGMPLVEARRQALVEFGSVQSTREQMHDQHPRAWFDTLRQDLRFAVRSLRRDRGFATVAILVLALGMGANIAVFSLVNTILLRPLPFHNPEQVVWMQPAEGGGGLSGATYSADAYEDVRDRGRSFSGVTGYFAFSAENNMKLTGSGLPQPITGIAVISNFLRVLEVQPELGRDFRPEDGLKDAPPVALLSHAFWKTHFHGDPEIVNQAISVDGKPVTVVGVLPSRFDFGATFSPGTRVDVLTPFSLDEGRKWGNIVTLIGRLKPGVTARQAQAEAATLFPQLYQDKTQGDSKGSYKAASVVPMKEHVAGQLRRSLYVLWSAVGMILLIVCVNLSNLLLSRAATRSKEFSLRFALGASRGRIIRQVLTESFLLSFLGAAIGIGLAAAVTQWLAHQGSLALPLISELRIDMPTLLWTVALGVAVTLLFGVLPGLRITADANLQATLKDSGPGTSEGRRHEGIRNALIVSEVALACVLVVGAGLLLRSFLKVMEIDLGFQPSHAAAISVEPPAKIEDSGPYYRELLRQVSALPGVQSAGISDNLPLARNRVWGAPGIKGVHYAPYERMPTFVYMITPGYLQTMGMHLRGRDISWDDGAKSEAVIVINERAAAKLFPKGDALDHMVEVANASRRIVGIVADVHETDVEAASAWQVYFPMSQVLDHSGSELVVRSNLDAKTLQPTLLSLLRRINPAQGTVQLRPMQTFVDHSTSPRRFFAVLVTSFAAAGLLLACLGIYGVISYSVTRQTQEIGIRMALGATPGSILRSVIQRTLKLAAVGIAIGTAASFLVAQAIEAMLYGTESTDPLTFVAMVVLLVSVAVAAGYFPARRAAHINPLVALRTQ
jgi:predicted permease